MTTYAIYVADQGFDIYELREVTLIDGRKFDSECIFGINLKHPLEVNYNLQDKIRDIKIAARNIFHTNGILYSSIWLNFWKQQEHLQ